MQSEKACSREAHPAIVGAQACSRLLAEPLAPSCPSSAQSRLQAGAPTTAGSAAGHTIWLHLVLTGLRMRVTTCRHGPPVGRPARGQNPLLAWTSLSPLAPVKHAWLSAFHKPLGCRAQVTSSDRRRRALTQTTGIQPGIHDLTVKRRTAVGPRPQHAAESRSGDESPGPLPIGAAATGDRSRSCACEGVHTAGWKSPSGGTFTRLQPKATASWQHGVGSCRR